MDSRQRQDVKSVTLGAVNWSGKWGDKAANLEKMKTRVREAARMGIDMVCFPELALTGYECGEEAGREHKPCLMHTEAAEPVPGPSTEEMAKLARELDIYVIFGIPEQDPADSRIHYNSVAVVGPEGVLGSYRKIQLAGPPIWTDEYCFKAGNQLPIFQTRYGPIGVQICADFWAYPELTRILALKGARIIFVPMGSNYAPGKITLISNSSAAIAQSTKVYIVACNFVGKERTVSYYGHSTIAGSGSPKFFKVFSEAEGEEEIIWATVSFEIQAHSQRNSGMKERGNWQLIASEYRKIADSLKTMNKE
jgi:predicted amidohydrolase